MTAENQSFEMYSGDTKNIIITMQDNLDGATVVWVLKKSVYDEKDVVRKTTGQGINVDRNTVTIRLEPDDTEGLSGLYYHETEVTDAFGNVSTVTTGNVNIKSSGI